MYKKSLASVQKIALMPFSMSQTRPYLLLLLSLYLGCLSGMAAPSGGALPNPTDAPVTDSTISTTTNPNTAVPTSVTLPGDSSETRKMFTITATLREGYDDNVFTANTGKQSSFTTDITPTVLFDLPMENSDFSARYTFDAIYYTNRPGDQLDTSHEFVARFTHDFSEKVNIDLREQFRYYVQPDFFAGTGTLYRDGAYISNSASAEVTSQWTPTFGSVSTYTNNVIYYQDSNVAQEQNNMENMGNQDFRFTIAPKLTLVFGGIIDNIDYTGVDRGYTSYSGTVGVEWEALPTLTLGLRAGGSFTDTQEAGSPVTPYAALTANWKLGQRSSLTFNYTHSVLPTDVVFASGQVGDRFLLRFNYDVTPDITTFLGAIYTHGDYTSDLITPNTLAPFTEDDLGINAGASYHVNRFLDFDAGYTFTNVSSELNFRDYTRNQFYVGVRGTY